MSAPASFLRPLGVYGYDAVEPVILAALLSGDPLLLVGRHGTGKTFLLNSLSEALGLEHRHYNASLVAFDDLVGFPYPEPGGTGIRYLETPATVWSAESVLVDELNRCRPEHQNRLFSLIHERRLQGLPLPRLRYRWAAMNPAGEEHGYLGAEPLDPALADRFAFVIAVADWEALEEDDRRAVTDPRGDGAVSRDGGRLREFLAAREGPFRAALAAPPPVVLDYARVVATELGKAGARLSPRRVRQLARNLIAAGAVSPLPRERLFRLVLTWSLPQRATGEPLPPETVQAAHLAAWKSVALEGREKWLHEFASEPDLARKAELLLTGCPDPDTGSVAVAQLIAAEPPARRIAFALAVHPHLLATPDSPVGAEGLNDLGRIAQPALHVEAEVTFRASDLGTTPPVEGLHERELPGYAEARAAFAKRPARRAARAAQYLDALIAALQRVPNNWPELLKEFEQCFAAVQRLRRAA